MSDSATLWTVARQASLSITNSQSLFKIMSIESVMPSNHLILCHPLHLLPFPASGSFQKSQFPVSGGQSIGASASILPMNIQKWFPLGWTGWISLLSKRLSRVFSNTTIQKNQFFCSAFFMGQLSRPFMTSGKTITLGIWMFVGKEISLLFNMLSRLVIAFLSRSRRFLISWLQSPSTVILEPKTKKSVLASTFSLSICHEVMAKNKQTNKKNRCQDLSIFLMLSFESQPHDRLALLLVVVAPWVGYLRCLTSVLPPVKWVFLKTVIDLAV